jgi:hypothetical protein
MSKSMTKYQLDHFRDKVKRQFEPMIRDQLNYWSSNLKPRQLTKRLISYLKRLALIQSLRSLQEAEKMLEEARASALTFLLKRNQKIKSLIITLENKLKILRQINFV